MWTHLSALIGFFFLMFYAYSTWLAEGSFSDKVMFLIWYLPHLHLYVAPVYLIARFAALLDHSLSCLLLAQGHLCADTALFVFVLPPHRVHGTQSVANRSSHGLYLDLCVDRRLLLPVRDHLLRNQHCPVCLPFILLTNPSLRALASG